MLTDIMPLYDIVLCWLWCGLVSKRDAYIYITFYFQMGFQQYSGNLIETR